MAQVTIYVPDWLHGRVKAAGLNVSRVCQDAFRAQLGIAPDGADHSQAFQELATGLDIPAEALAADDGINHWAWATPESRIPVDCTAELGPDPARAGFTVRHIGTKVRHRWGNTCSACGGNWG